MSVWLPSASPSPTIISESIDAEEVLFFFDEPLIFSSKFMSTPTICYKYAEDDDAEYSFYIAAPTSGRLLSALKQGKVSIRGAISIPSVWIYEADASGQARRWWNCSFDEIPESILPVRNVGLRRSFGSVPDQLSLRRSDAPFLSVNFLGGTLHAGDINLLDFRNLVDSTYSCLRDIIRRAFADNGSEKLSVGQMERMLSIPFRQPHFASLQLNIGRPVIEDNQANRVSEEDHHKIDRDIDRYRSKFLDVASVIAQQATSKKLSLSFARENIDAIENILGILPSEDTAFQVVEIIAEGSSHERVRIGAEDGQKILNAYKTVQRDPRSISGQVVEVNFRSDTFIIKTSGDREITCVIPAGWVGDRPRSRGETVTLYGKLQRRKRRDLFFIDRNTFPGVFT